MARPIRVEFAGATYHVTARGNERKAIFRGDPDRRIFLATLAEAVERFSLQVPVYCLMPNHYHLVVSTPEGNLSRAIGWLQTAYTIRFNLRHRRSGHLFQGRFKALLVEADGYARQLIEYIHLNPVRMGIKRGRAIPADRRRVLDLYPWSSHRVYAGLDKKAPGWLDASWMTYYGQRRAEAQREYRQSIGRCFRPGLPCPWDGVRRGLVLGGESLLQRVRQCLENKDGMEELRWKEMGGRTQRAEWVKRVLQTEEDPVIRMWMRVELAGERSVEVAREEGYRDGSGVCVALKRLKARAHKDRSLQRRLAKLREESLSIVKS